MVVLRGRGDQLVVGSSFAAVRELLWAEVQRPSDLVQGAARLAAPVFEAELGEAADRDRVGAVLHGLYWLVAGLAERERLLLVVDDAHWLDPASARFVVYLARRIESLPALLVVGLRIGEGSEAAGLAAALGELAVCVLRPAPLSEDASAVLIRGVLGPRAGDELCHACYRATAGNPFYLRQLVAALAGQRDRVADRVTRVQALGAGAVARSVLVRLAALGSHCGRLAQAVAVLGPGSALRHAARLAGLEREGAELAADRLRAAELLAPGPALSFVHPIVGEAIAGELPGSRRSALHREAAQVLLAEGALADRVAAHLLSTEPYGEGWVVEALRAAGRAALAQGAPEAAVSYLRRALAEPPGPGCRLEVLVELGRAEALLPDVHDFPAFREALELATGTRRVDIVCELADALMGVTEFAAACVLLEGVLTDSGETHPATAQRLEAYLIAGGVHDLPRTRRVLARAGPQFDRANRGEVEDPFLLTALATSGALAGRPADEVAALARRALRDQRLWELWTASAGAAIALTWSDQLEEAAGAQDRAIAEAQRRGAAPMFIWSVAYRSYTAWRAGDLELADDHAERALELARELGPYQLAQIYDGGIFVERGRAQRAADLLEPLDLLDNRSQGWQVLLAQRGQVRVAVGDLERGLADLLEADRKMSAGGLQVSVLTDWVPAAVLALTRLGHLEQAQELAARELTEAVAFGAPRRHGIALSTCGTLDPGDRGLAWLRAAVAVLERSPARLEHARALVNLGAGLRGRGEREQARELLAQALDAAHRLRAAALVERARTELIASGARPRRPARSGRDALTPAELRTASMAAQGLTNRQIAQALFVSARTVEAQLHQAYAKLAIGGRAQLAKALATDARTATTANLK
jgi:DNA-binding CsgD family transcriptional regulator